MELYSFFINKLYKMKNKCNKKNCLECNIYNKFYNINTNKISKCNKVNNNIYDKLTRKNDIKLSNILKKRQRQTLYDKLINEVYSEEFIKKIKSYIIFETIYLNNYSLDNIIKNNFDILINNNLLFNEKFDLSNILKFKYDINSPIINIINFSQFVEDSLKNKNEFILTSGIKIINDIIIDKKESIKIETENGEKKIYNMDKIIIELNGEISFGGENSDKKININYNVTNYIGLLRCNSTNNTINKAPTIENLNIISENNDKNNYLIHPFCRFFKVLNCINNTNINLEKSGAFCYGYAGINGEISFYNCINNGDINGDSASGICGNYSILNNSVGIFNNCINNGNINNNASSGFISYSCFNNSKIIFDNCSNLGNILYVSLIPGEEPNSNAKSGFIGDSIYNNCICEFTGCINKGEILNNSSSGFINSGAFLDVRYYLEFIIKKTDISIKSIINLNDCINHGDINSNESAGFCNYCYKILKCTFNNCVNKGNIFFKNNKSAGFIKTSLNSNLFFINCINEGNITSCTGFIDLIYNVKFDGGKLIIKKNKSILYFINCINKGKLIDNDANIFVNTALNCLIKIINSKHISEINNNYFIKEIDKETEIFIDIYSLYNINKNPNIIENKINFNEYNKILNNITDIQENLINTEINLNEYINLLN